MLAYAGRYTFEGDKITHHVDISWNQLNIDLQRFVEVKNNQLTIKTPPFILHSAPYPREITLHKRLSGLTHFFCCCVHGAWSMASVTVSSIFFCSSL
jgi:hypothetical protein